MLDRKDLFPCYYNQPKANDQKIKLKLFIIFDIKDPKN